MHRKINKAKRTKIRIRRRERLEEERWERERQEHLKKQKSSLFEDRAMLIILVLAVCVLIVALCNGVLSRIF